MAAKRPPLLVIRFDHVSFGYDPKMVKLSGSIPFLVLDGGRVAEAGAHDQITARGRKYSAMWETSRMLK